MSEATTYESPSVERVVAPDRPPPPAIKRFDAGSPVVAIAQGHLALQFALAGIRVEEVSDAKQAETTLEDMLDENLVLVIVDETFSDKFSQRFLEKIDEHKGLPLVVFCPTFEEEKLDVDAELAKDLKQAIGYEIRLD